MNIRKLQFSLKQSLKAFGAVIKQPRPFGWTTSMTCALCALPVLLWLLHPFDAQISVEWSGGTTKIYEILSALTNVIKSEYWLILAVLIWGLSAFYINSHTTKAVSICIIRARQAGIYLFFAIVCATIPVTLIKYLVGRARPHLLEQLGPEYFSPLAVDYLYTSFPSGHAMMAGILVVFSYRFLPRLSVVIMPLCFILAFSRIVVVAHYPTDVLAGFMIGVIVSLCLYNFMRLRNIIA